MRVLPILSMLVLAAGCVTYGATNSPIDDGNAIAVPEVVGAWSGGSGFVPEDADTICLRIEAAASMTYRVVSGCRARRDGMLTARFGRFGGELMAVVQAATTDSSLEDDTAVLFLHQFFRVEVRQDSLFATELDAGALRDLLVRHPAELPFALLEGNGPDVLLTATPDQLARFLTVHARDSVLWDVEDGTVGLARAR